LATLLSHLIDMFLPHFLFVLLRGFDRGVAAPVEWQAKANRRDDREKEFLHVHIVVGLHHWSAVLLVAAIGLPRGGSARQFDP